MKTHVTLFLVLSLFLSGCSQRFVPVPTTVLPTPTPMTIAPATATLTSVVPVLEAPSLTLQPTETIVPTDTVVPTETIAVMDMQMVPGAAVSPQANAAPGQSCQVRPSNWVRYTVQPNDTLSSLGQRTGVGWQKIQSVNCLGSTMILAGQVLYLPYIPQPAPVKPNLVPNPGGGPAPTLEYGLAPGPGNPRLEISPTIATRPAPVSIYIKGFPANVPINFAITPVSTGIAIVDTQLMTDDKGNAFYPFDSSTAFPDEYTVDAVLVSQGIVKNGEFRIQ